MNLRPLVVSSWLCLLSPAALWAQAPAGPAPDGELKELLALRGDAERGRTLFARCEFCHRKVGAGRVSGWTPLLAGQHASVLLQEVGDNLLDLLQLIEFEPRILAHQDLARFGNLVHERPTPVCPNLFTGAKDAFPLEHHRQDEGGRPQRWIAPIQQPP